MYDGTHGFPLAGEGDRRYLGRLVSFLPDLPIEILNKLERGGLGLGSSESKFFGLHADILEGGRADRGLS